MSYCPKCGKQILDESLGCPVCSLNENATNPNPEVEEEVEVVKEFTVEDESGASQKFKAESEPRSWEDYKSAEPKPVQEQTIHTVLKVIIILAIIIAGGIGQVAGIISGVVLLKSPIEDYRKFGKTLIILSCVMLGIWFLCCFVGGLLGFVGNVFYYFPYY
ncbi:hypothetical protein [Anaerotignum sp. MB30-C6]|uniref:hypothetical protein n=1 Tax=Anaerotignum sp. MB30-C6 TaxID=3070814 RepID=UPI0027DD4ACF|nr:hypothetical protein [Anaerotignum sp. MB30-C6]WMI81658.1 hypothetical protein RBQ60_02660 [Anaerotignum sp. MB30-C6]